MSLLLGVVFKIHIQHLKAGKHAVWKRKGIKYFVNKRAAKQGLPPTPHMYERLHRLHCEGSSDQKKIKKSLHTESWHLRAQARLELFYMQGFFHVTKYWLIWHSICNLEFSNSDSDSPFEWQLTEQFVGFLQKHCHWALAVFTFPQQKAEEVKFCIHTFAF